MYMDNLVLDCPHCLDTVLVEQIACGIFRHGVYVSTGQQINPHMPEPECTRLTETNAIYGCGRPFRVVAEGSTHTAVVCDYI